MTRTENMKTLSKIVLGTVLISTLVMLPVRNVFAIAGSTKATSVISPQQAQVAKAQLLDKAQKNATKIYNNQFLHKLNELRVKVNANNNVDSASKAVLLSKVDAEITWFTGELSAVNTATTIEQVRLNVKNARTRFLADAKEIRRLYIAHGFVVALEKVINNLQKNIFPKIDEKLTELSEKGIDVTAERNLYSKLIVEGDAAKAGVTLIKSSTTFEDAKKNYIATRAHIKNIRQYLQQIITSLKAKLPVATTTSTPTPTATVTVAP